MEQQNITNDINGNDDERWKMWEKSHRRGKKVGGVLLVLFGALFLARELGAMIPAWLFTWKMVLIAIGIAIAFKSNFRNWTWLAFIGLGIGFIIGDLYPEMHIKHIVWPLVLIFIGMVMIFKPRRKWDPERWNKWQRHRYNRYSNYQGKDCESWCRTEATDSEGDHIDSTSVFGGVKKNIISKNFKGGEITNVFGGAEYNLSQADFNETITLEITQFFGGTRLIIPSNWEIKSELTAVLGSIEDKRPIQTNVVSTDNKVLILKGTSVFGGIELRS
jgi:predicted membrane protein